jgi:PHO85 cyclin-5
MLTPGAVSQVSRELPICNVQKSKYVIGLVDQAVKSLCDIWHPQDIPNAFMTLPRATVTGVPATDYNYPSSLIAKQAVQQYNTRNTQSYRR